MQLHKGNRTTLKYLVWLRYHWLCSCCGWRQDCWLQCSDSGGESWRCPGGSESRVSPGADVCCERSSRGERAVHHSSAKGHISFCIQQMPGSKAESASLEFSLPFLALWNRGVEMSPNLWEASPPLGLIHTGRARKLARFSFDVACMQCEHSHWRQ